MVKVTIHNLNYWIGVFFKEEYLFEKKAFTKNVNNSLKWSQRYNCRIGKLGCGYEGSGLVCCPKISEGPLFNTDKNDNNARCGQSSVQGDHYEGIGAYPWLVRIGFRSNVHIIIICQCVINKFIILIDTVTGEIKYPCTGTIIDKKIILTAAHCALARADNYKL